MAIFHLSRPEPARGTFRQVQYPGHDRLLKERLNGTLELSLTTVGDGIVAPGTGRLGLEPTHGIPVHAAARRLGLPIIPGSGIKGACRTLYELLSAGCILYSSSKREGRKPCWQKAFCEVCSLFGCPGVQGRVSFSDAVPDGADAVRTAMVKVRPPWQPKDHFAGEFRLYDTRPAKSDPRFGPPVKISREGYQGRFRTRLWVRNLAALELGRLLLAMGLTRDLTTAFAFRLGGAKYDGLGVLQVMPEALRLVTPQRGRWTGEDRVARCRQYVSAALDSPWAELFAPTLETLSQVLGEVRP